LRGQKEGIIGKQWEERAKTRLERPNGRMRGQKEQRETINPKDFWQKHLRKNQIIYH